MLSEARARVGARLITEHVEVKEGAEVVRGKAIFANFIISVLSVLPDLRVLGVIANRATMNTFAGSAQAKARDQVAPV